MTSKCPGAFLKDNRGATSIEYAVIAALVSIVVISGLLGFGGTFENQFSQVDAALN